MQVQDPIHLLKVEHDATLAELESMELAVADLNGARRAQALATLQKGLDFLEHEVRAHGQLEEDVLYPALDSMFPSRPWMSCWRSTRSCGGDGPAPARDAQARTAHQ